jgi:transposase
LDETDAVVQFCWAHIIRDVKFLTTLSDPVTRRYGQKLVTKIKCLFRIWHRREQMPKEKWERAAQRAAKAVLKRARRAPPRTEAQNIAQRFRDYPTSYFTFLKLPGVEPTNNSMEQRMRFVAIDRKITQGTRSERGRRWCERIWTVLATCVQQGRSAFQFLYQSIVAHFSDHAPPSLLAIPP